MESNNKNQIYNLQQLKKQLLELDLKPSDNLVINEFSPAMANIYGVFSADNSFVFAKEKSCLEFNYSLSITGIIDYIGHIIFGGYPLISKKYYLIDFFSRTPISDSSDEKYIDGDIYEYNGTEYYVVLLSKILPASFLTNIPLSNISIIQDAINVFLADNPEFISQIIFEDESSFQNDHEPMLSKKLVPTKTKKEEND